MVIEELSNPFICLLAVYGRQKANKLFWGCPLCCSSALFLVRGVGGVRPACGLSCLRFFRFCSSVCYLPRCGLWASLSVVCSLSAFLVRRSFRRVACRSVVRVVCLVCVAVGSAFLFRRSRLSVRPASCGLSVLPLLLVVRVSCRSFGCGFLPHPN